MNSDHLSFTTGFARHGRVCIPTASQERPLKIVMCPHLSDQVVTSGILYFIVYYHTSKRYHAYTLKNTTWQQLTQANAELPLTVPPTVRAINTRAQWLVKACNTSDERPSLFYDHFSYNFGVVVIGRDYSGVSDRSGSRHADQYSESRLSPAAHWHNLPLQCMGD